MKRKSKRAEVEAAPTPPTDWEPLADRRLEALLTDSSVIYAEPTVEQERLILGCMDPRPDDHAIAFACGLILGKLRTELSFLTTGYSPSDHLSVEGLLDGRFDPRLVGVLAAWAIRTLLDRNLAALLLEIRGVAPVVASDDSESVLIHARVPLRRCRVLVRHRAAVNPGLIHPDECESPFRLMTPEEAQKLPQWLSATRLLVVGEWSKRVRPNASQVEELLQLFEDARWRHGPVRLDGIEATVEACVKAMKKFLGDDAPIRMYSDGDGHMVWEEV